MCRFETGRWKSVRNMISYAKNVYAAMNFVYTEILFYINTITQVRLYIRMKCLTESRNMSNWHQMRLFDKYFTKHLYDKWWRNVVIVLFGFHFQFQSPKKNVWIQIHSFSNMHRMLFSGMNLNFDRIIFTIIMGSKLGLIQNEMKRKKESWRILTSILKKQYSIGIDIIVRNLLIVSNINNNCNKLVSIIF